MKTIYCGVVCFLSVVMGFIAYYGIHHAATWDATKTWGFVFVAALGLFVLSIIAGLVWRKK